MTLKISNFQILKSEPPSSSAVYKIIFLNLRYNQLLLKISDKATAKILYGLFLREEWFQATIDVENNLVSKIQYIAEDLQKRTSMESLRLRGGDVLGTVQLYDQSLINEEQNTKQAFGED